MRLHALMRPAIVTAVAASVTFVLAGCATGAGGSSPAEPGQIAERAASLGIDAELVYTTRVDGYELAVQSVGPSNSVGMSATWFDNGTGEMLTLRTAYGELSAESCPAIPIEEAYDAAVTCEQTADDLWHRWAAGAHEYVAVRDDVLVRVSSAGAPPEDLRAAADAAHVPSAAELDRLFADAPENPPGPPVERGDLPENGDGAPVDPQGPGG